MKSNLGPNQLPISCWFASIDVSDRDHEPERCHLCGVKIDGQPSGRGLFLWTRGDELRWEEPALCERCAPNVALLGEMKLVALDNEQ